METTTETVAEAVTQIIEVNANIQLEPVYAMLGCICALLTLILFSQYFNR